jgi:hypothetical protein
LLQIPNMIEQVTMLDAPVLDRSVCERIFGVRRRRAIELMQRFGGYQAGNTVLVDRLDLICRLQRMLDDPAVERERQRKQRLSEQLEKLEKHRRAAAVRIPVGPEAASCTVADLPSGVSFVPGQLTVRYDGVEELLCRLYELAQAAANDFDSFSEAAGVA